MKFGGAFGDKKNKIRKTIYKVSIRHHRVANENPSDAERRSNARFLANVNNCYSGTMCT